MSLTGDRPELCGTIGGVDTAPAILIVQHEDSCPPAWLGEEWLAAGRRLDVRTPYRATGPDSTLPRDLSRHSGLVVLGGEMGAHDDAQYDWLAPTKTLLREAVAEDLPTLGVCLGHQLLAVALGGRSERNPAGTAAGRTPLSLNDAGRQDPLLRDLDGRHVVQLNGDVVTTAPQGTQILSHAPDGSIQAARFASHAWGVQFHPEAAPEIFDSWTIDKDEPPREFDAQTAAADVRANAGDLRAVNDVLAERFLAIVTDRSVQRAS